jgi:regulator of RNase E activity RraA
MSELIFAAMRKVDTPTISNALDVILGTRAAVGFTRFPTVCADPQLPPVVGYARTAKIRAASAPLCSPAEVRELRLQYYEFMEAGKPPVVTVIEDTDWPHCVGAFWGEVNTAIHKGLGVAGVVTNGLLRDLDELEPEFQVIASNVGPSHAFVHVTELDSTVNILGMTVRPGDIIHADRHGAVVIAPEHLAAMPAAIQAIHDKEAPILAAARAEGFSAAKLRELWPGGSPKP